MGKLLSAPPEKVGREHLAGGVSRMKDGDSMTATEAARLIEWLEAHGHTAQEATECIKYIAAYPAPATPSK